MPPSNKGIVNPEHWLKRAKSNLARAKQPRTEDVLCEDLCFDAQQATEKALKALLLYKKISFRFVHDIGELLATLERGKVVIPTSIKAAAILTTYAVETRYPGPFEQVTQDELYEAISIAEQVVQWVESQISTETK